MKASKGMLPVYTENGREEDELTATVRNDRETGQAKNAGKKRSPLAIGRRAEVLCHMALAAFALFCIMPFVLSLIISFTEKETIKQNGYSFLPKAFSIEAYEYIGKIGDTISKAFFNSFFVTAVGTLITVTVTILYAYALTRKDFRFRKFFTWWCFFPMLFSGGLAPTYVVVRKMLGLHDSYAAIIVPMLLNSVNIVLLKTLIQESVPRELIDAAAIDGCGEYRTLRHVVLPLAKPGFATITLMTALGYYNEWFIPMLYVHDKDYKTVPLTLMEIKRTIESWILGGVMTMELTKQQMARNEAFPKQSLTFALVVLMSVPVIVIVFGFQKYLLTAVRVGRIKE